MMLATTTDGGLERSSWPDKGSDPFFVPAFFLFLPLRSSLLLPLPPHLRFLLGILPHQRVPLVLLDKVDEPDYSLPPFGNLLFPLGNLLVPCRILLDLDRQPRCM